MASGVKFEPPSKEKLFELAIKHNGNVRSISADLNIIPHTLYKYFKENPEAKDIIDFVRGYNHDSDLDLAEQVNRYNMANYVENSSLAQRAAEFTLTSKGESRGWNNNHQNTDFKVEVTHIYATSDGTP